MSLTNDQKVAAADAAWAAAAGAETALYAVPMVDGRVQAPLHYLSTRCMGDDTRAGAVLARMMAHPGCVDEWALVSVRARGRKHRKSEIYAAERIAAAARLVDIPLSVVILVCGPRKGDILWEKGDA